MDLSNLSQYSYLAFLAPIVLFWNQARGIVEKCFRFFIRTDVIEPPILAKEFTKEIFSKHKPMTWGNKTYAYHYYDFLKNFGHSADIFYVRRGFFLIFYRNIFPVIVSPANNGYSVKVTYFCFTINTKKILEEACHKIYTDNSYKVTKFYISEVSGRESVEANLLSASSAARGSTPIEAATKQSPSPNYFEPQVLSKNTELLLVTHDNLGIELKNKNIAYYWQKEGLFLKNSIKHWLENRNWFYDRSIIHRRGCILYGKPGTGKTKMILECAKHLDIPIIKVNISNMSEQEFSDIYFKAENPCVFLIEDIDVVFNFRENVLAKNNRVKSLITFDSFINVLGGAKQRDGIYVIVTTNKIETMDPSLLRAGRLDLKIEVGDLDEGGRRFVASNILKDWPELIEKMVIENQNITVAEFENKCIELAIDKFYNG